MKKLFTHSLAFFLLLQEFIWFRFHHTTDTLNRELQTLEANVQQQKVENETLKFEMKELSKPERIIKIAKENGLKIQDD